MSRDSPLRENPEILRLPATKLVLCRLLSLPIFELHPLLKVIRDQGCENPQNCCSYILSSDNGLLMVDSHYSDTDIYLKIFNGSKERKALGGERSNFTRML
ncbi:hypothetical protein K435DRAFT_800790 [Dendrothele bispora CBS 962.96]|uniref:Uncharacterized protein n=1 Tax=Dendrothele bispora (strain CBS 962.96) TaxID=1314807 RepID=A0A4S8LRM1_DENBC|nr:hypothetical protein K435DRAFT_800790 [Dendrothele bispora CBS 962.96]